MNKNKIDFRLQAVNKDDVVVIYMYGDIADERPINYWTGEEEKGDYIIPSEFFEMCKDIKTDKIDLHINSYGGSVFASVSIFNYIKALNKDVTVYVDGVVASGGSIIAMSGNKIVMPKNTTMMIHRASSFGFGNCNDLRKLADTLEKLDNATVFETYKARFKGTDEQLKTIIDKETWLSADECLEYGLCDEVLELSDKAKEEPKQEEISNAIKMMTNFAKLKLN